MGARSGERGSRASSPAPTIPPNKPSFNGGRARCGGAEREAARGSFGGRDGAYNGGREARVSAGEAAAHADGASAHPANELQMGAATLG